MNQFVITVAQQKGGAGKTTIASHLSVVMSDLGYRTAIIDIDPQGSMTKWFKEREKTYGKAETGLTFSAITGWRVNQEIERLSGHHDIVIIDSPPHVETEARTAIRSADLALVPVQPSPTDLWATQATIDLCRAENVAFHLVMNRVNTQSKIFHTMREQLGDAVTIIGNRVAFASSMMHGQCVTEFAPYAPASDEIVALADEVISHLPASVMPSKLEPVAALPSSLMAVELA